MDGKHRRLTSSVACHHRLWTAQTVEQYRAWHAIIALGRQTWSNYIRHGLPPSPLGTTHCRKTAGVSCHHRLWVAHTVERRRAWHAIIALGWQTRSNDVRGGMPSSPLGSTHGRTTSGVACHHLLWAAHTIERLQEWHAIIALGRQTRSNNVRLCIPASPLGSTHGRTTLGVA